MIADASIFVGIALLLFFIGFAGFIKSKSAIRMLIAIELMLNSANINFAIFALYNDVGFVTGQIAVIISIAVAAAEAAVGLGIILSVYRNHGTGPAIVKVVKQTGLSLKDLCRLFPCGMVKGAYKLAGLPKPPGCT